MKSQAINQLINFFWTITGFSPVVYLWLGESLVYLFSFIVLSLAVGLLPNKLFRYFQLSNYTGFYERLGVRLVQKYVQNGTYINKAIQKNNEHYKVIRDRTQAGRYLGTIAMYERYHIICFVFFGLTLIYAGIEQRYILASLILAANIIYNLCPIMLQQYNKLRVKRLMR